MLDPRRALRSFRINLVHRVAVSSLRPDDRLGCRVKAVERSFCILRRVLQRSSESREKEDSKASPRRGPLGARDIAVASTRFRTVPAHRRHRLRLLPRGGIAALEEDGQSLHTGLSIRRGVRRGGRAALDGVCLPGNGDSLYRGERGMMHGLAGSLAASAWLCAERLPRTPLSPLPRARCPISIILTAVRFESRRSRRPRCSFAESPRAARARRATMADG